MLVEIWSDVVCPFCYIGKREFEKAMAGLQIENTINIIWKSYELAPNMPFNNLKTSYEWFMEKYQVDMNSAKKAHQSVADRARTLGLIYNFEKVVPANTNRAHQMLQFSKDQGNQYDVKEALMKAYFTDGKQLDNILVLLKIGEEQGLDREHLRYVLERGMYVKAVLEDRDEALQYGFTGVPTFLINKKYFIKGAQNADVFKDFLKGVLKESGGISDN